MLSWQGQYTLFQQLTSDEDSSNLSMGKTLIRAGQRKVESKLNMGFTEEIRTFATVTDAISGTSNLAYYLPENFKSLTDLYVTSGTTQYHAELVQDDARWRTMQATTTQSTSNFLSHCFIRGANRLELYPIPSSALTATIIYEAFTRPLTADDYTTGTITTLANAGTAVTASGSTFTSAMAGRYFRIDSDGEWYKIASFGTTTTLTLLTKYQGIAISAGSEAYTIGQMPVTPADTHELPVYYAVWKWALFKKDTQLAREYERMWKEGLVEAQENWANRSSSNVIGGHSQVSTVGGVNPNDYPQGMS